MPRLAFLLQTHDANPHLERLCTVLSAFPDSRVFCHHDFSKSDAHPAVKKIATFCQPHRVTSWSTVPVILAELDLFQLALKEDPRAEWLILLSGHCYPNKPIRHITDFLALTPHQGFVDSHAVIQAPGLPGWWWKRLFTRAVGRIPFVSRKGKFYWREIRRPRRQIPFSLGLPPRYGANWIILRRGAAKTLMNLGPHGHPILRFFEQAEKNEQTHLSPEECVVQTLLGELGPHGISPDYLRFIDWVNAVNWHPNTLTERHWEVMRASEALFARKFDAEVSRSLLDRLDREVIFA